MNKIKVLAQIESEKIVPVIRVKREAEAEGLVAALLAGGIHIFEITLTVPNAAGVIKSLCERYGERILIGAGTVLDETEAEKCVVSGAKFIVSPICKTEIVTFCLKNSVAVFPAGLTPNEIFDAHTRGADAVKVFPADALGGAKYLKSLKTVFPAVKLMPTGGVSVETAADFLAAGAFAVGLGTDLADPQVDARITTEKATNLVEIARSFSHRSGSK